LNLSDLINAVHKDKRVKELRLRKDEVKILTEVFIDHIGKGLINYGIVKLQGLFTLDIRKAKGRKIANPQTGEHMKSKDYYKIGVKPSKKIKEGLGNLEK
jgi:nucleoid DNA-binding protein